MRIHFFIFCSLLCTSAQAQLSIATGDSISVMPGTIFTLQENLINNGKIYNGGVLTLNGTALQNLNGTGNIDNLTADNNALLLNDININNILLVNAGSIFDLSNFTLNNTGFVNANGSLKGSANAGLSLFGSGSSTVQFDQSIDTSSNALKTISISNGTVMLQNKLYVYDAMLPNSGTVTLNDELILRSNNSKTARVAPVGSSFIYGSNGKFVIERYIPGRRAWRLLTAPVTPASAVKISDAWQDSKPRVTDINVINNTEPGYGTHVTFGLPSTNGYDQGVNGNPSIRYLNATGWNGVPTATNDGSIANSGIITDQPGYMLFVRGDRGTLLSQATGAATTTTVLRPKGKINTGVMNLPLSVAFNNFRVVSNPYPSAVNFHSLVTNAINAANGFADVFYLWDPNITGNNGVGGFVAMSYNTAASILAGKPVYDRNVASSISNNGDIQSGAAFLIQYAGAATSLRVEENDKSIESDNTFFRPVRQLQTNLFAINSDSSISLNDGVLVTFDESNNDAADKNDVKKLANFAENISVFKNASQLCIEKRKPLSCTDSIQFIISKMRQKKYRLDILFAENTSPVGSAPLLIDSFLNRQTALSVTDSNQYFFDVTSNTATAHNTRFKIIMKPVNQFLLLNASLVNDDVQLQWALADTVGRLSFTVERSSDSLLFKNISSTTDFTTTDIQPMPSKYFYRIRCVNDKGVVSYSAVKKITVPTYKENLYVYPNPVTGISTMLRMKKASAGFYHTRLLDNTGKAIAAFSFTHAGGMLQQAIPVSAGFSNGMFELEVSMPGKQHHTIKLLIQR